MGPITRHFETAHQTPTLIGCEGDSSKAGGYCLTIFDNSLKWCSLKGETMLRLCKILLSLFQHRDQISRKTRSNNRTVEYSLLTSIRAKLKFDTDEKYPSSFNVVRTVSRLWPSSWAERCVDVPDSHPCVPSILSDLPSKDHMVFQILVRFRVCMQFEIAQQLVALFSYLASL